MMISKSETMPLMMAVRIEPMPLTMAISTEPMVRQIDSNCESVLVCGSRQGERQVRTRGTYTRDDGTHCDCGLDVMRLMFCSSVVVKAVSV
jgi:hypothetical protein